MTQGLFKNTAANPKFISSVVAGTVLFLAFGCSSDRCDSGGDCFSSREIPAHGGEGGVPGKKPADKPESTDDQKESALGGNGGEEAGAEPAEPTVPSCVPAKEPDVPDDDFEDTNCDGIDGDVAGAIFVSPLGEDTAEGTINEPVASLAQGIRLAQASQLDVYVCKAIYPEELKLEDRGVNIFGGYDCGNDWQRGDFFATVAPPSGTPLTVRGVSSARIERLHFEAPAATGQGASSVGGVIANSEDIQLHAISIAAGAGFMGIDGDPGAKFTARARTGANATGTCTHADCSPGGTGGYINPGETCPNGGKVRQGGRGGNGGDSRTMSPATNGSTALYTQNLGGIVSSTVAQRNGKSPSDQGPAANGTASSQRVGSFQEFVYQANNSGAAGTPGSQANGGGGGAGANAVCNTGCTSFRSGDGGGQGGFGGCGGAPGTGGTGGGGSFGLLIANSVLTVTMSEFSSSQGGNGGAGAAGAAGQLGGEGGKILGTLSPGGAGARGANGGKGGDGAPGGGGPSIVIALLSGDAPIFESSTFNPGQGGIGGRVPSGGYGPVGLSLAGFDFSLNQELEF